jgi:membrane protein YdbS with pleckstrin-like domain
MTSSNPGGFDSNAAAPISAPPTPPATGPHAPPDHDEIVYYEGSPLVRGGLGRLFEFGFIGLILILIPFAVRFFHYEFPPFWVTASCIIVGLLMFLIPALRTKTVRYRITNYRIDYERGLLARNIDTIELWHVEDLHFHQSLLGRALNVGSITVTSRDETTPKLELLSLPNPRPLYETLKQRVIAVKRQQGVLKVDPG